jgi:hypothetical protein
MIYEYGEPLWNNIYTRKSKVFRRKPKNSERNPFHCHFAHYKSHIDLPGSEPGSPR